MKILHLVWIAVFSVVLVNCSPEGRQSEGSQEHVSKPDAGWMPDRINHGEVGHPPQETRNQVKIPIKNTARIPLRLVQKLPDGSESTLSYLFQKSGYERDTIRVLTGTYYLRGGFKDSVTYLDVRGGDQNTFKVYEGGPTELPKLASDAALPSIFVGKAYSFPGTIYGSELSKKLLDVYSDLESTPKVWLGVSNFCLNGRGRYSFFNNSASREGGYDQIDGMIVGENISGWVRAFKQRKYHPHQSWSVHGEYQTYNPNADKYNKKKFFKCTIVEKTFFEE